MLMVFRFDLRPNSPQVRRLNSDHRFARKGRELIKGGETAWAVGGVIVGGNFVLVKQYVLETPFFFL